MPEYCVTGGTGFIAAHLIQALLAAGHKVRATVRDPEDGGKVGFLWGLEGAKERLQIVKADLMVLGSFDEAINGVDGVFHTASPVVVNYEKNIQENLIDPIIKGAVNVLKSCAKAASVRRVVFTSSCSCIRYCHDSTKSSPLNEAHWSDTDYCKTYNLWYAYAKTLAEKEAWRLAQEQGMDLVVVNPSFVVGPMLAPQPTSTILILLAILRGELPKYPNTTVGFVHINDVVRCHMLAMEDGRVSGRLICSCHVAHWSEILESLRAKYPHFPIPTQCSSQVGDERAHEMDTSKIKALGVPPFLSLHTMFDDCIKSFQERGLL